MIRVALLPFLLCVLLFAAPAGAAELRSVQVDYKKGFYTMKSEVWFDATLEQMWYVFRRWDYSADFSSAIVESRDVEADEQGRPQYYSRMKGCVLFFCLDFVRQGHVELEEKKILQAFADPEISDFHRADETWTFAERDGGTVVNYHLTMKPKFWVPPGIGPFVIKRKLRRDAGDAIDRIEVIAQSLEGDALQ